MFLTASEVYNEGLRDLAKEILDEVKCFISKPLTIEDLVRKVREEVAENPQWEFQLGHNPLDIHYHNILSMEYNSNFNSMGTWKYIKLTSTKDIMHKMSLTMHRNIP